MSAFHTKDALLLESAHKCTPVKFLCARAHRMHSLQKVLRYVLRRVGTYLRSFLKVREYVLRLVGAYLRYVPAFLFKSAGICAQTHRCVPAIRTCATF